ncbi:MAG TPA: hypothetical protein VGC07_02995 [Granulicella sp.]
MARIILATIAAMLLVALGMNRNRIYVRDPLGKVYRRGVRQQDNAVLINFSNDVLVMTGPQHVQELLIDSVGRVPGTPQPMSCLRALVCLSEDAQAPMLGWKGGVTRARMSSREVTFNDDDGTPVRIALR